MRVKGGTSPKPISIETYPQQDGYVEIRLRENIAEVTEQSDEKQIKFFEYDEYLMIIPNREGLQNEIETNFEDWVLTGRTLEFNDQASIAQDMQNALEILGVKENA